MSFKKDDIVLMYYSAVWHDGGIGKITAIDTDTETTAYLVQDLFQPEVDKWTREYDMQKLNFNKTNEPSLKEKFMVLLLEVKCLLLKKFQQFMLRWQR